MNPSQTQPGTETTSSTHTATHGGRPRNVVVGVGGGIAAYKACGLVRWFTKRGENVRVVPTENALRFVGAATFEALSGNPVNTGVFSHVDEVEHVRVGQQADLVVIAPATADLIARLAMGRADDLLTATVLVATCPVVVAPAMHTEMWRNAATQANVATLRARGVVVLEPAHGRLTGPDSGPGRLPEPEQIAELAEAAYAGVGFGQALRGKRVVVTAGGTQENLDPVRFLGNRSSGKQGFALAELASQRGADVLLIAGHTDTLPTPNGVHLQRIRSARELQSAVVDASREADAVIMAAAVADFRPASEAITKLKKGHDDEALHTLQLVENPDILAELVAARGASTCPYIVGFAAETAQPDAEPLALAQRKLERKGCDLLMCNDVSGGGVFGREENSGWLLRHPRSHEDVEPEVVPVGGKLEVAGRILDAVAAALSS